jgi:hypothetical protein
LHIQHTHAHPLLSAPRLQLNGSQQRAHRIDGIPNRFRMLRGVGLNLGNAGFRPRSNPLFNLTMDSAGSPHSVNINL